MISTHPSKTAKGGAPSVVVVSGVGGETWATRPRHKAKLQALVAVARKMLHAIFGMFRWHCDYDGSRLLPRIELPTASAAA